MQGFSDLQPRLPRPGALREDLDDETDPVQDRHAAQLEHALSSSHGSLHHRPTRSIDLLLQRGASIFAPQIARRR